MTCIVGVAHRDGVILGGDRITVSHNTVRKTNHPKVFKRGRALLGSCGSVREGNIIETRLFIEDIEPTLENVMDHVVKPLREMLREAGCLKTEHGVESTEGAYLIGIRNKLFTVYCDFQVDEYLEGYNAVGAGEDFALGSLFTSMVKDPRSRVKLALEASAYHCAKVCPPFDILSIDL